MAEDPQIDLVNLFSERIAVAPRKGFITPKGANQRDMIQAVRESDIVLAIGPAGTGKTYLAVPAGPIPKVRSPERVHLFFAGFGNRQLAGSARRRKPHRAR